jgi:hypothetical protein
VALRARRLGTSAEDAARSLPPDTLRTELLPAGARSLALDVIAALAGSEGKLWPEELEDVGASPRDRLGPTHPLRAAFDRVVGALCLEDVALTVSDKVPFARVVTRPEPWIVAPAALSARAESTQVVALARALTRVALGMPWIDRFPPAHMRALLVAAVRTALPAYGGAREPELEELVQKYTPPIARAIGRKQKKALAALEPSLEGESSFSVAMVDAFVLGVMRAELRVGFVLTGDLLATLDDVRVSDAEFARATSVRGPTALAATLAHPLAGDVVRFALTKGATALRRRTGAMWGSS